MNTSKLLEQNSRKDKSLFKVLFGKSEESTTDNLSQEEVTQLKKVEKADGVGAIEAMFKPVEKPKVKKASQNKTKLEEAKIRVGEQKIKVEKTPVDKEKSGDGFERE